MSKAHAPLKTSLAVLILSLFSPHTTSAAGASASPEPVASRLVADEHGVLRLHAGSDGKSALKLAEALSADIDSGYLVVVVMTNDQYEAQAIAHGRKLQAWFEKQASTRDHVPLVVHKNTKGVGYVYYMFGLPYIHDERAPAGVMTVQQSVDLLGDAKVVHMARMQIWNVDLANVGLENETTERRP